MNLLDKTTEYKKSTYYYAMEILEFFIRNEVKIIQIDELRYQMKFELLKFIDSLELLLILDEIVVQKGGRIIVKRNK
ncbi:MAG: hypothetical protein ACRC6A_10675 [Fusobacteriaceae bacterium]